ncbi:tetratricopeptide repeat protein [Blastopirellula marina]|uniref:Tetratricopeptide repeat protein n=1 Tax=Blastopirellula marina TaxID=124 RepID=A0A2S8GEE9_9BACT|nr:tetratricopeptide repeat protein [Blastopirellula marina]PQO42819.1 hypothetical protein C5Y98_01305 [Blastopirellula marina]PTL46585.1 tetratricopeptide repeat protein [Blastopirellula marina]
MKNTNAFSSSTMATRLLAMVLFGTWLGVMLFRGAADGILVPFAWTEVGAIYILCGLPIAIFTWRTFGQKILQEPHAASVVLAISAALMIVFYLLFWNVVARDAPVELLTRAGMLTRIVAAIIAANGLVGACFVFIHAWFVSEDQERYQTSTTQWIFALLLLLLVPATYERARCQADAKTAFEYLSQSRLAEAAELLKHCAVLQSNGTFGGKKFDVMINELAREIEPLKLHLQSSLSPSASIGQRIERGTHLAILGRSDEAIVLLLPSAHSTEFAENNGHQLLGTLYQDRHDWDESLFHFHLAYEHWQNAPSSAYQQAGLLQALPGQALALRKLGRIEEAEATYQQLVQLAPSAENHFLLAQFYEDIQETSLATQHAQQAMLLSPAKFQTSGEALISKMKANHFGCFQLFRE